MNETANPLKTIYRLVLLIVVVYGLVLSFFFPEFSVEGLPTLAYFTTQSNVLVALFLLYSLARPIPARVHIFFRGTTLLSILVTGLVFHLLLVSNYPDLFGQGVAFRYHLTHTVAPLGFILDWLAFDRKRVFKLRDLTYWLMFPLLYWIFTTVRGSLIGVYPYFFMDLSLLGTCSALLWLLIMMIIFTALGLLIILVDRISR